ncbi:C-14 sterol reductase [Komagataella phaffii CBS 7435]|uniref:Delta(14)-sterol reductase n=2 Tax=Komagataella phaffii TaxID=460519 RepID=C4QX15_KOMPG|nr:C-14 sterol reductase, acts in ergosterol biosynthesis [Komagataella phaffii GS115]AOA61200.1 GQ67_02237T0 [Komagataella phaffii]CAH2446587.1 C-14 sterol reductase [Komagataella phaffii CBS 7435]AOA65485.1 GQ68_02251T0 [Komagataella phaffii GS115]CAY67788.1 C-14 sterol reductase, acts in ergosterol biosynthesis [Komagataella phaffii GS115]CCA36873.1 C-14 sterol reductase [Komagataella phaffii CBS 7435]
MVPLNEITAHKDFLGVPGAISISLGLPIVVVLLYLLSNPDYVVDGFYIDFGKVIEVCNKHFVEEFYSTFANSTCWKIYLGWFGGLICLDLVLPGKLLKGVILRDGTQLKYHINGLPMAGLLASILVARWFQTNGSMPELQFLYNNILNFSIVTIEFSFILATACYLFSFIPLRRPNGVNTRSRILAVGGNTKNPIFDWFIGRELNPRIGSWDIKLFCELRPGMLLWLLINLSCLHQQYLKEGKIFDSLLLVNFLQMFYIIDGVLNEEGLLTMMDIATDGFGFMLAFGDLTLVPFTYSLQSRYLVLKPVHLGLFNMILICILAFTGYYIFHSANSQKSKFRQGLLPSMKSIETETGSKLLVDGWWRRSQHINYLGDWLIAWSWCLPTGFNSVLPYYYVIYFGVLLVHRQTRDEDKCQRKYGKYWTMYQKEVPYKIIPYVY